MRDKISFKVLPVALVGVGVVVLFMLSLVDARGKALEKGAVSDIRTLGTALMVCLSDAASCPEAATFQERLRSGEGCSDLTPEEAAQLVLKGSDVNPAATVDPWGGPYELCVERGSETHVMVVRSAGPNGRFEPRNVAKIISKSTGAASADAMSAGAVSAAAVSADLESDDLVWADGYFISWPKS